MSVFRYLLIFVSQLVSLATYSQNKNLKFLHLGIDEGLSQTTVSCILQDSKGLMWFGTRNGLNKYDGYNFTVYINNAKEIKSISNNIIKDIVEDNEGNIWIATDGGGLNMLDKGRERFICYKHDNKNSTSIASDYISSLLLDKKGNLWVGTNGSGLDIFDKSTHSFTHHVHNKENLQSLTDNYVQDIFEDSEGKIWVGTVEGGLNLFNKENKNFASFLPDENRMGAPGSNTVTVILEDHKKQLWVGTRAIGLNLFNTKTHKFISFKHDPQKANSIAFDVVLSLAEDNVGNLWIGTENGGLSILDLKHEKFNNYQHDDIDNASLSNNSVWSIFRDVKGNMWVGTFSGGISFFNRDASKFIHYRHTTSPQSLSNNTVFNIMEDSENNLWVATDGGGVNMMENNSGSFKQLIHDNSNKNSLSGNHVLKVFEDSEQNLWIGTWGDGITVLNRKNNTYKFYKNEPSDVKSLSGNNIWTFFEDKNKNIWIGTYGEGLNLYNKEADNFIHYKHNAGISASICDNIVRVVLEDNEANLWLGTASGLNKFNPKANTFKLFIHDDKKNSISGNTINCIYKAAHDILWIGTDLGLSQMDLKTEVFTNYHVENGLPGEAIFGILEDDHGNLWIGTNKGLCKFNPKLKTFKNFDVADGLQSQEFKQSCFKSRSGKMYFGGINGFNEFFPDSIKDTSYDPPLVLTGFQIFNTPVPLIKDADGMLRSITEVKQITLSYDQSVISFEFASLNYTAKDRKKYAYLLEGFDKDWNDVGIQHTATYTNLNPGAYTFKLKGLDNEGKWSVNIKSITLIITPPYWQTWWFRISAVIIFIGGIILIYRYRVNAIEAQKHELEKQVSERTDEVVQQKENLQTQAEFLESINVELITQKEEIIRQREEAEDARADADQANKAKSVFLATMSHEIRTPMNGVIGMASLLNETTLSTEQREYTDTIRSCGESLLTVINDILDFSKIESGKMELEEKDFDLRNCIEEVLDVFAGKASKIGLDLIYEIDYNVPAQIIGDSLRLRQIIMNLVGNAIKFTSHGEVFIGVHLLKLHGDDVELGFEVRDTGIGIPEDKLDRLFKAFSQVDSSTTRQYGGTGLGLVICEKLIGLMGGIIKVESQVGLGATFSFTIKATVSQQSTRTYVHHNLASIAGKRVLVIDDNPTNLKIIKNELEQWKLIPILAASGEEALTLLGNGKDFDLVLTDMQMPAMDGMQLATRIRQVNPNLPIILLSSVGDEKAKTHSLLFDSILTKPVRQSTLRKHILVQLKQLDKSMADDNVVNKKLEVGFAKQYPLDILIAEDNPVNLKLADRVLTKLGYKPAHALNGQEASDALSDKAYDIIFMDVQMPVMDGMEATQKIRLIDGFQPVIIAMTANAMQGDREKCLEAGMNDYISKPIRLDDLVTLLEKWSSQIKNQGDSKMSS